VGDTLTVEIPIETDGNYQVLGRFTLDPRQLPAYTCYMRAKNSRPVGVSCLCGALRQASRAVSRLYDQELRDIGLRTTQYSLLQLLRWSDEVRQRDLAELTLHDETTLTRNLRPLVDAGWVAVRTGEDRREKWLKITAGGVAKLEQARPAWERAQTRMQDLLPEGAWQRLLAILPVIARLAAGD
jgi:DNA-binding MarR family transcriptional regulator